MGFADGRPGGSWCASASGTSWAAACWHLFFRRAPTCQLLSHHQQLGFGRDLGGPVASYLAPQVLQPLPWLCLAFFQPEKPAGIQFPLTRLQVVCFLCQMPGSLIWGGPGMLCTALYLPFLAPTAWAGDGDLAHVDGDKTWEGNGVFWKPFKTQ